MFEVDYGSGSVLGMEGSDDVTLAGLGLSQVHFGLVIYEDQQVTSGQWTGQQFVRSARLAAAPLNQGCVISGGIQGYRSEFKADTVGTPS